MMRRGASCMACGLAAIVLLYSCLPEGGDGAIIDLLLAQREERV